jgi:ubiquitin carboxyl-terminal hydrolase 14
MEPSVRCTVGCVTVKWGVQTLELSVPQPAVTPAALRASIEALTGVPAARQKLMCAKAWKGLLKDDAAPLPLPGGSVLTLMGTAELVVKPAEAPRFIEDASAAEVALAQAAAPSGLVNLGNTCYANSALQCLRVLPELREAAKALPAGAGLGSAFGRTMAQADTSTEAVEPVRMVQAIAAHLPTFEPGKQQDAEEFVTAVLGALAGDLRAPFAGGGGAPAVPALAPPLPNGVPNLVDTLLGVEVEEELTCLEAAGAEPPRRSRDGARKLVCAISGTGPGGKPVVVSHLSEGLQLSFNEAVGVTMRSAALGRDALWARKSRIVRLPKYLCVQMMRFFFKRADADANDRGGAAGVPCKVLKAVSFPTEKFDVLPYCTPGLVALLSARRAAALKAEDERRAAEAKGAAPAAAAGGGGGGGGGGAPAAAPAPDAAAANPADALGPGVPADFEGYYDLTACVVHRGRDSASGHYIAFSRRDCSNDGAWNVFDDDEVSGSSSEVIRDRLKGGGDDLCVRVGARLPRLFTLHGDYLTLTPAHRAAWRTCYFTRQGAPLSNTLPQRWVVAAVKRR